MKRESLSTRLLACILVLTFAFSGIAASKTSKVYDNAIDKMSEGAYAEAAELFDNISSYEDASTLGMYCKAIALAQDGYYENAISAFNFFGDYKDCRFLKTYYSAKLLEKQAEEDPLLYLDAADMFETIRLYKDSIEQANGCRQKLYEVAVKILTDMKDPILDKEQIIMGFEQVSTVEDYLSRLEPYIDVQDSLISTYFLLGEYYFYGTEREKAEEYFIKSGEENPVTQKWIERCKMFSDLKLSITASICDLDGYSLLNYRNPHSMYLEDVEDSQALSFTVELSNKGEKHTFTPGFKFTDQEDGWVWKERSLDSGESGAYMIYSLDPDLKDEFLAGEHTCILLIDDLPFEWYDYEIQQGLSKEKQEAKKMADSLDYEFYMQKYDKSSDKYTKINNNQFVLSDLKEGEVFIPFFKVTNNTDKTVNFNLSALSNNIPGSWSPSSIDTKNYKLYRISTNSTFDKAGEYTIKYYLSSCFIDEFKFSIFDKPEDKEKLNPGNNLEISSFKQAKEGSFVEFGHYEQDNDFDDGKEPIVWRVLDVQDNKFLLLSEYALDCHPYNTPLKDVTWETCTLREWLNDSFMQDAFNEREQASISITTISPDKHPEFDTDPGNVTKDKLFLLSINEVNKYFKAEYSRQCIPTEYSVANGSVMNKNNGMTWWWLRTPGQSSSKAARVSPSGSVTYQSMYVHTESGSVRPAMWIDINSASEVSNVITTNTTDKEDHTTELDEIRKAYRVDLLKLRKILEEDQEKLEAEYKIAEEKRYKTSEDNIVLIAKIKDRIDSIKNTMALQAALIEELNFLLTNNEREYDTNIEIKEIKKAHRVELLKLKKVLEEDLKELQAEYEITEVELNKTSEDDAELIQEIKDIIVNLKERISQHSALIEELNNLLGNRGYEYNEEGEVIYTVIKGDTLPKICAKCGLDYWKNSTEILEMNGLENESQIYVGQILKLPG